MNQLFLALALCVLALGCSAHDTTGMDVTSTGGASANGTGGAHASQQATGGASAASGTGGANTATGTGGTARAGTGGASASSSGGSSASMTDAGTGGASMASDAGAMHDAGSTSANTPDDPECDLNGIWITRLTTFSLDSVGMNVQTASSWFYYEIAQNGRDVTVTAELDCGIQVSGSADVTISRATTQALLTRNDQTGRKGSFYKDGDHCSLSIDRFYSTRGIPRASYLPADLSSKPDLTAITPALPTMDMPDGAEDWDMDGNPGISFNVSGAISGARYVVQRDWNEFASDPSDSKYQVALNADMFTVRAQFDSSENILGTGGGALSGLLAAGSAPQHNGLHRIVWKRLGRQKSDPGVSAVRVSDPTESCYNVQSALPHDPTMM